MFIETSNELSAGDFVYTKVTKAGAITEVMSSTRVYKDTGIKKLDADTYLNINTGEVKEYRHTDTRLENINSVRRTIHDIRMYVNANADDPKRMKWVTFTYAENMRDTARLYHDWKVFLLKFKRYCRKHGYEVPEYIKVAEPQGRGAWHLHVIFIWLKESPFIPNEDIAAMWGQGFTTTKAVNNCDNIGAYFSAYLTDMPLEEAQAKVDNDTWQIIKQLPLVEKEVEENGIKTSKKMLKGARLYLYPTGMHWYSVTKGIKAPVIETMSYDEWMTKEKSLLGTQTFSSSSIVHLDNDKPNIVINREYYNRNRKNEQIVNAKENETNGSET